VSLTERLFTPQERREQYFKRVIECAKKYATTPAILTDIVSSVYPYELAQKMAPFFAGNVPFILWLEYIKVDRMQWLIWMLQSFKQSMEKAQMEEPEYVAVCDLKQSAVWCGMFLYFYLVCSSKQSFLSSSQFEDILRRGTTTIRDMARLLHRALRRENLFHPLARLQFERVRNWSEEELVEGIRGGKFPRLFTANIELDTDVFTWVLHIAKPAVDWLETVHIEDIRKAQENFERWERTGDLSALDVGLKPIPESYRKKGNLIIEEEEED
jgi:hypothetical protein